MISDIEVRIRGLRVLVDALGPVEAEHFVTLLLREPFDYTRWQRSLWDDKGIDAISGAAMALHRTAPPHG